MKRFSIKNFWFLKPIKMKNFCHPLLSYLERRIAGERNLAGFCVRCFTWSFLSIFSTILIQESYVKKEKKVELWSVGPRLAVRSRSLHRKDILVEKMWKNWFSNIFDRKKLRSSTGLELKLSEQNDLGLSLCLSNEVFCTKRKHILSSSLDIPRYFTVLTQSP